MKTGFPQRAQRSQPLCQACSPHRAPRSPWGSGRGGAPGHPSYPAGSVCKKHSLHCLQETLSCLQTTFSSIKGCLEVSRGLSAWRRLSQRKFPCPLAGLAPEAEGTARGDRGEAAHPRPRAGAGMPGRGAAPPDPSRPSPLLAPPSRPHASLGSTWRVGRAVSSFQLVPNPEIPAAKAPRRQRGAARCQVVRHQRPPLTSCGPQVSRSEPCTAVVAEA